jgi:NAD(P)-dependent dehydrogenase (short-subunit alcohol dehydrogenase family)
MRSTWRASRSLLPCTSRRFASSGGTPAAAAQAATQAVPSSSNAAEAMASYGVSAEEEKFNRPRYYLSMVQEVAPAFTFATGLAVGAGLLNVYGVPAHVGYVAAHFTVMAVVQRVTINAGVSAKDVDMKGKVCVVTGGSSGIGQQTAARLAAMGATVVTTFHSSTAEKTLEGIHGLMSNKVRDEVEEAGRVVAWPLALDDRGGVLKFVNTLKTRYPAGVDVLVNNAGCSSGDDIVVARSGHEKTLETNVLGTYALSELAAPLVHKAGGRMIFLTSHGHRMITHKKGADPQAFVVYHYYKKWDPRNSEHAENFNPLRQLYVAKFANLCQAVSLHERGLNTVAVNPGRAATQIRRDLFPELCTQWYWPMVCTFMKTPREASHTVVTAATAPADGMHWGGYYYNNHWRPHAVSIFVGRVWETLGLWCEAQTRVTLWAGAKKGKKDAAKK